MFFCVILHSQNANSHEQDNKTSARFIYQKA